MANCIRTDALSWDHIGSVIPVLFRSCHLKFSPKLPLKTYDRQLLFYLFLEPHKICENERFCVQRSWRPYLSKSELLALIIESAHTYKVDASLFQILYIIVVRRVHKAQQCSGLKNYKLPNTNISSCKYTHLWFFSDFINYCILPTMLF